MKKDNSTVLAVFLCLFCFTSLLLLVAKPTPLEAQEKKTIRLVVVSLSWSNQLPLRIAMAKNYFKEQGLEIEPIFIRGGPAAMAALISGDVDFGSIGGAQAIIRTRARGLDVSIIGSVSNSVNYVVIGRKGKKSVEDLKNQIIGVTSAGAFSDFAMRLFFKKHNLDPERDVTLRAVGNTTMRAAALEKGLVAAAPFSPDDAVRLTDKGFPLIANLNKELAIPQSIIITRGEVLAKQPEASKRFLKALILGLQVAKNNKEEAIRLGYAAGLKGERDVVEKAYDLYAPGYTTDLTIAREGIQHMLAADITNGLVDKNMTVESVIDDHVLKLAQEELKKEGRLLP
jgi:ABC-type nitrate/sulfonate/bicarbonate transport system substrate-binding protein